MCHPSHVLPSCFLALRMTSSSVCCRQGAGGALPQQHCIFLLQPRERSVGKKSCTKSQAALCPLPHGQFLLPLTPWLVLLMAVLHGQVYRFCTLEGTWLMKENSTLPWRNLSECEATDQVRVFHLLLLLSFVTKQKRGKM